jgi:pheromone shutdown protein TraB
LLILSGFVLGFNQSSALGWNLVLDWILINGGLSALGAALAGAHILTIFTAFIAAPLTSLNPTIGAGMVTAAAELYLRKPTVKDFENVRKDTTSLSGWRKNRVARLLLIFLFSTLGSIAGTYIAGFQIFEALSQT